MYFFLNQGSHFLSLGGPQTYRFSSSCARVENSCFSRDIVLGKYFQLKYIPLLPQKLNRLHLINISWTSPSRENKVHSLLALSLYNSFFARLTLRVFMIDNDDNLSSFYENFEGPSLNP